MNAVLSWLRILAGTAAALALLAFITAMPPDFSWSSYLQRSAPHELSDGSPVRLDRAPPRPQDPALMKRGWMPDAAGGVAVRLSQWSVDAASDLRRADGHWTSMAFLTLVIVLAFAAGRLCGTAFARRGGGWVMAADGGAFILTLAAAVGFDPFGIQPLYGNPGALTLLLFCLLAAFVEPRQRAVALALAVAAASAYAWLSLPVVRPDAGLAPLYGAGGLMAWDAIRLATLAGLALATAFAVALATAFRPGGG